MTEASVGKLYYCTCGYYSLNQYAVYGHISGKLHGKNAKAEERGKHQMIHGYRVEYLRSQWADFINSFSYHISDDWAGMLRDGRCEPVAIEGNTLILGFKHAIHRDRAEIPANRKYLEEEVNQWFSDLTKVRCILLSQIKVPDILKPSVDNIDDLTKMLSATKVISQLTDALNTETEKRKNFEDRCKKYGQAVPKLISALTKAQEALARRD